MCRLQRAREAAGNAPRRACQHDDRRAAGAEADKARNQREAASPFLRHSVHPICIRVPVHLRGLLSAHVVEPRFRRRAPKLRPSILRQPHIFKCKRTENPEGDCHDERRTSVQRRDQLRLCA